MMMVAAAMGGGPGWGTAWPATLGWGCTQGPSRASVRHQRVTEADTRGALATKGTIFQARLGLARESWGWLWGAAEPQLWQGVAVGGAPQKVGGLLRACNWKERWSNSLLSGPEGRPVERPSLYFTPSGLGKWEQGSEGGSKVGEFGKREAQGRLCVEGMGAWLLMEGR